MVDVALNRLLLAGWGLRVRVGGSGLRVGCEEVRGFGVGGWGLGMITCFCFSFLGLGGFKRAISSNCVFFFGGSFFFLDAPVVSASCPHPHKHARQAPDVFFSFLSLFFFHELDPACPSPHHARVGVRPERMHVQGRRKMGEGSTSSSSRSFLRASSSSRFASFAACSLLGRHRSGACR